MSTVAGDVEMGPDMPIAVPSVILRWFDQHVKDIDRGLAPGNSFHAFRLEGNEATKTADGFLKAGGSWQTFDQWPPRDSCPTPFYLTTDRRLSATTSPAGQLAYDYDPRDPVPTIGGNVSSGNQTVLAGPADQRGDKRLLQCRDTIPLAERRDVLCFRSDVLNRDTDITGPIWVRLFVSSSAVDTDFTAKLVDEYPPSVDYPEGYAMNVQDGIVRVRLRSFTQAGPGYRRIYAQRNEPLTPGEVVEVTIELWSASVLFRAGHRIRLDVSSSNFPRFDINPNTGEPFAERVLAPIVAHNVIHVGHAHPSCIMLPMRSGSQ
jgi:putative CocE/NonD family hydrolase